jgi:hypothetical protein
MINTNVSHSKKTDEFLSLAYAMKQNFFHAKKIFLNNYSSLIQGFTLSS